MNKILNSQYPIVAMAMNKVSDIPLARAVRRAGGVPSLSIFNYFTAPGYIDHKFVEKALLAYKDEFGDLNLLLSIGVDQLIDPRFSDLIVKHNVQFVELIPDTPGETEITIDKFPQTRDAIKKVREGGSLVFVKAHSPSDVLEHTDGAIIKGANGAGRGNLGYTLEQLFDIIHQQFPEQKLIVSGGIGTSAEVKHYMDKGAIGIGIGTLFAASKECRISTETKLKMIAATSRDIQRMSQGAPQNALIFKEIENDHFNNTKGLVTGITDPGAGGHVFAGTGIDYITEILPVADIIQNLVKDL
jgi:NAD(P)H-dependent flavin oxidoreductase YrpB (nitropropane dioxygenase family)